MPSQTEPESRLHPFHPVLDDSSVRNDSGSAFSSSAALPLPRGQLELGTFAPSRVGVTDRLQLGVHPIFLLFFPRIEAKVGLWRLLSGPASTRSGWALSSRHAFTYQTRVLDLVSKEGSLGLLPQDTRVP